MGYVHTQALQYNRQALTGGAHHPRHRRAHRRFGGLLLPQFKQVTGIAPVEYLRRYGFARAMELLAGGESVTDVSRKVGFKNLCHFSRDSRTSWRRDALAIPQTIRGATVIQR
jgi:hypothetical protein